MKYIHTAAAGILVSITMGMAPGAYGQSLSEITGPWNMKVNVAGQTQEMRVNIEERDGQPALTVSGPQGSTEAENVSYQDGLLSWGIKFGPANLFLEVTVEGDTFSGTADSPFGELEITGEKLSEDELAAAAEKFDAIVGDWNVFSTYEDETIETSMRFYVEDGDLKATVSGGRTQFEVNRFSLEGDKLRWAVPIPYMSSRPGRVQVTLSGDDSFDSFEGTLQSAFGEVPITGELVDTTKLVQAAYDSPEPLLGKWNVETEINGETGAATVEFFQDGERVKATITSEGTTYESSDVEYEKINEEMYVVRVTTTIPDVHAEPLTFELIVDGPGFTGEEIHHDDVEFFVFGEKTE